MSDVWAAGAAYEPYMGRWSRLVARRFVDWLDVSSGSRCLDVGCGTGALSSTMADTGVLVTAVDPSPGFVAHARAQTPAVRFAVADAMALPVSDETVDVAVSGLVLNFVPEPGRMAAEMSRVVRPGGAVGLYVWDYAGGMEMIGRFWAAATAVSPSAAALDQSERFPVCHPEPLRALFCDAGLADVDVQPVDVRRTYAGFDEFWSPFLGGTGPAPSYVQGLGDHDRKALRTELQRSLPAAPDGSLTLAARAWAVRGRVPAA